MSRVDRHTDFVKRCAAGHAADRSYIIGMRSGFFGAAHLVDTMRAEVASKPGRRTKAQQADIALLEQVGDSIWAMKDLLPDSPKEPA